MLTSGARLGAGAVVGAAAVVDFEVPPYAVVAGNPARIVGYACECGAKLGDFFLHSEPDGPFFGLETEALRAWLIERPLRVEASSSEGPLDEWLRKAFAVSG